MCDEVSPKEALEERVKYLEEENGHLKEEKKKLFEMIAALQERMTSLEKQVKHNKEKTDSQITNVCNSFGDACEHLEHQVRVEARDTKKAIQEVKTSIQQMNEVINLLEDAIVNVYSDFKKFKNWVTSLYE